MSQSYTCVNGKLSPTSPTGQATCQCIYDPDNQYFPNGYFFVGDDQYDGNCSKPTYLCQTAPDGSKSCDAANCDVNKQNNCFSSYKACKKSGCQSVSSSRSAFMGSGEYVGHASHRSLAAILIILLALLAMYVIAMRK